MIKPDKVMPTDQLRLKYVKSLQTNRTRREQDITVTPELSPGMVILINTLRGWSSKNQTIPMILITKSQIRLYRERNGNVSNTLTACLVARLGSEKKTLWRRCSGGLPHVQTSTRDR